MSNKTIICKQCEDIVYENKSINSVCLSCMPKQEKQYRIQMVIEIEKNHDTLLTTWDSRLSNWESRN